MHSLRIILTLSILFSGLLCNAQKTEHFDFTGAPSLSNTRIRSTLHVIDQRNNKENLGHKKTGFNKFTPILPAKPVVQLLSTYYGTVTGNEELLLVLHDFDMVYNDNEENVGTFYFSGDFFSGIDGKYKFIERVDSIYEVAVVKNAVAQLADTARARMAAILNWYGSDNFKPEDKLYTEQETVNRRSSYKTDMPIYKTTSYKKGIYYTADQFIQNQPVDTGFIIADILQSDRSRLIHINYVNKKGKKGEPIQGDTYFAIYDGKQWYTGTPNARMNYENEEFYTTKIFNGITNLSVTRIGFVPGLNGSGTIAVIRNPSGKRSPVGGDSPALYKTKFDPEYKEFISIERL